MSSRAPERTCIGCRSRREQACLYRISKHFDNRLRLTIEGERVGRGAYICPDAECVEKALKGDRLARALRFKIAADAKQEIEQEILCQLR